MLYYICEAVIIGLRAGDRYPAYKALKSRITERMVFVNIEIKDLAELYFKTGSTRTDSADDGFRQAIEDAVNNKSSIYNSIYFNKKSYVAISSKFEEKMREDPELAREIAQKIEEMTKGLGSAYKDSMIVIDRSGEITQYNTKTGDKRDREREIEELKEVAKARMRRKARLDAYFKIVQQISLRRKLIEQENIKRPRGKRYRSNTTKLDSMVRSILQQPKNPLPYYF